MSQDEFKAALKEIASGDKFIYEPRGTLNIFNGTEFMQFDF
jgi:hypothetical protein